MPSRHVTPETEPHRCRFGLYRLCLCPECDGRGYMRPDIKRDKCPECRGEGRVRQEVAECDTPEAVGVALVTLAREGEWEGCQFGLLDREGETGKRWLILPWPDTARTVTAAAKLLAGSKRKPS